MFFFHHYYVEPKSVLRIFQKYVLICLSPVARLNTLLLPRELYVIVDHIQRVRTIPNKDEIAGCPEIAG